MSRRSLLLVAAVVAALALGGVVAALTAGDGNGDARPDYLGSEPPPGITLPAFTLRDYTGERVSSRTVSGKVVVVTFLDSQCTEACPVIAGHVARALALLTPAERSRVVPLAITTDPREDTPASVRAFLRKNRAEGALRYLLGGERELRRVWRAFAVLPSLETGDDDLHSAPVRVYDRRGTWVATQHAGADLSPARLAHDLRLAARA